MNMESLGKNEKDLTNEGMAAEEFLSSGKTPVLGVQGEVIGMASSKEEADRIYREYREKIDLH